MQDRALADDSVVGFGRSAEQHGTVSHALPRAIFQYVNVARVIIKTL